MDSGGFNKLPSSYAYEKTIHHDKMVAFAPKTSEFNLIISKL